jgi:mevalonate kinase
MSFIGLGKVILLGEHSVVYGYPALAAAIDRGVRVAAVPTPAGGTLRLDISTWNAKLSWQDDHPLARGLAAIADHLHLGRPSVTLVGDAQIPLGAGIGGSAAFAVAVARALIDVRERQGASPTRPESPPSLDEVVAAANASEQILHGRPSGVDSAMSAAGGVGVFRKVDGLCPVRVPAMRIIVGPSGEQRSTAAMIQRVAQATSGAREDKRLIELGSLTDNGTRSLLGGDTAALGVAMDRAHALLADLGVSTPMLDRLCESARRAGAYGTKLTGAGGGGAVIALAPRDKEPAILAAWRGQGVSGFVAQVGDIAGQGRV